MSQSEFLVRDYRAGDYNLFAPMWAETGLGYPKRGDNEDVILKTLEIGGRFLVLEAIATNEIIGTSWITVDGRRSYLHHFGIHPQWQGKGLSKLLLVASLKILYKIGLQPKIEVHRDNQTARKLYEKYGFNYLGDYDVLIIRDISVLEQFYKI